MALFSHGSKEVGATAVQLVTDGTTRQTRQFMAIRAALGNTGTLYVGSSDSVNGTVGNAACGWPLAAGESITIPITEGLDTDDESTVWVIASAASQNAHWWYK